MPRLRPIRLAIVCASAATLLHAQSRPASQQHPPIPAAPLPATPTTQAPPPIPPTPAQQPAQRAKVTYADDLLTVSASNSSLNQILREISRQTGIKITGGVADERVFGDYGPAAASQVLASLLDGTASNMVIVQSTTSASAELILTPRMGGATPPNPNAARFDDSNSDDQPAQRPEVVQPNPPQPQTQAPAPDTPPAANTAPVPSNPETPAPAPPSGDSTQQQSPNGVKTPQQIYDELMRIRQQQSAPPK